MAESEPPTVDAKPWLDRYDQRIADKYLEANNQLTGLHLFMGMKLDRFEPGRLYGSLEVRDEFVTPLGTLHGGTIAAFLDHILGSVAYPLMERGQWAATTEFKLNYLASVKGGTLEGMAEVVTMTRRSMVVRGEVMNDGRLVAIAQGTLMITDPKS
jgi:uncharacterized protein (TIGR00369 family)